ncbi:GDP-mannose transporter [Coccomyxa sp. Obi]|nr:GDP-mannose transporter [Coccomyxa sp. Obi]
MFFFKQAPATQRETAGELESLLTLPKKVSQESALLQDTHHETCRLSAQVAAACAYCFASGSMVLLNKAALSSWDFQSPILLLFFQCLSCCIFVAVLSVLNLVCLEPWNLEIVRLWLPVNVIFVGMIWSSFSALRNLGVPMATVLKNMTNIFTICGDYAFYGKVYGAGVWASLALICVSAICGSITDLAFNLEGYMWQLVNCLFTAFYSLYLRGVMDRVVPLTVKKARLDEFSMVFYNNFLSLPLLLGLIWWHGELHAIIHDPVLRDPSFIMTACASALVAFGISFASLWFLSTTTATTYSLVGSLNKIPIAAIGLFAFNTPWNSRNAASIAVGLIAGLVFVKAKSS